MYNKHSTAHKVGHGPLDPPLCPNLQGDSRSAQPDIPANRWLPMCNIALARKRNDRRFDIDSYATNDFDLGLVG